MKYLSILMFVLLYRNVHASGSAGNGGDGIFCSWRAPMTLDYYTSALVGGVGYGEYSLITDLYSESKGLDELTLQMLKEMSEMSAVVSWQYVGPTEAKEIYKGLKKAISKHYDYRKWTLTDEVPMIRDSLHDEFIPEGCQIKQVAQFKDGTIRVSRDLFNQLDEEQKQVLALHEAIYYFGRKAYGHTNSYLTRNLVRGILRRLKHQWDIEIHDAINEFRNNKVPEHIRNSNEDLPGSALFNNWRLNIFDLQGKFELKSGSSEVCAPLVIGQVQHDLRLTINLNFNDQVKTFRETDFQNYITYLNHWFDHGFLNRTALKEIGLEGNDRTLVAKTEIATFMGLNRKDEFYIFDLSFYAEDRGMKNLCTYKRILD